MNGTLDSNQISTGHLTSELLCCRLILNYGSVLQNNFTILCSLD